MSILLSGLPSVAKLQAPQAKKIPHVFTLHGTQVTDNYAWMKNRQDPDLMPYLTAENSYTQAVMADTALLQEELYKEMRKRVKEDNSSVPARHKKHVYYTRTHAGNQYAIRCVKASSRTATNKSFWTRICSLKAKSSFPLATLS